MALKVGLILLIASCGIISSGFFADAAAMVHSESRVHESDINPEERPANTVGQPKKIIFDSSMEEDFESFDTDDTGGLDIVVGSEEDEAASQWYVVTRSGYEYKGSPEVLKSIFKAAKTGSINDAYFDYQDPESDDVNHFIDQRSKRKVFPPDTRKRVTNVTMFPYAAMGRVERGCTGTFIGPRHILTAGHCVYNTETDQWKGNLDFRRCKDCPADSGTYYKWKASLVASGYKVDHLSTYDYGMIVVEETSPVTMEYGYANGSLVGRVINIAGYPGDLGPDFCLWRTSCKTIVPDSPLQLSYQCDTAPGMSGSAVYRYWSSSNKRIINCVHALAYSTANRCTRITSTRYQQLKKWIEDN